MLATLHRSLLPPSGKGKGVYPHLRLDKKYNEKDLKKTAIGKPIAISRRIATARKGIPISAAR